MQAAFRCSADQLHQEMLRRQRSSFLSAYQAAWDWTPIAASTHNEGVCSHKSGPAGNFPPTIALKTAPDARQPTAFGSQDRSKRTPMSRRAAIALRSICDTQPCEAGWHASYKAVETHDRTARRSYS